MSAQANQLYFEASLNYRVVADADGKIEQFDVASDVVSILNDALAKLLVSLMYIQPASDDSTCDVLLALSDPKTEKPMIFARLTPVDPSLIGQLAPLIAPARAFLNANTSA